MALETGNYVGDLVVANPGAADPKSQGDDHLRLIKTALRQSFPGYTGAILVNGVGGGPADVYTLTPATALVAYVTPLLAEFTPAVTNATTTPSLNVSALGAKTIVRIDGSALVAGELASGAYYLVAYDGTYFRLLSPTKQYVDQLAFGTALPAQAGNTGKFLQTVTNVASWHTLVSTDLADYASKILGIQVALAVAL